MNSKLEHMMAEATRLMRSGSLMEATAAIQAALGNTPGAPFGAAPFTAGVSPLDGFSGRKASTHADVVDVEARTLDDDAASVGVGVGSESFVGGSFRNELGFRDYKLFEPARDGTALPLVVMLHGCTQDPEDFARGTGMNELARAQGFLVLYPEQSQRANTSRCWNWFKHNHQARGRGEPGILAGMVREVIATHGVDPKRVYVAGLSAGGAMAAILGDAYPDLFAAVGVHSGLPTGSATDVQTAFAAMKGGAKPVRRSPRTGLTPPTIVFHGDSDTTVHIANGERVMEAAGWTAKAGAQRESSANGRDFTRQLQLDEHGAERAERWTIHGAGHAWSGGRSTGSYTDPRGPDASAEMLRFFRANPLR